MIEKLPWSWALALAGRGDDPLAGVAQLLRRDARQLCRHTRLEGWQEVAARFEQPAVNVLLPRQGAWPVAAAVLGYYLGAVDCRGEIEVWRDLLDPWWNQANDLDADRPALNLMIGDPAELLGAELMASAMRCGSVFEVTVEPMPIRSSSSPVRTTTASRIAARP